MFLQMVIYVTALTGISGSPLIATNKLSLAEWGSYNHRDHKGPGTYAYGYDIEDPVTGNVQFKQEERHRNGTVTGSYGYIEPNGRPRILHYISDENGYRVTIESAEPQTSDVSNFPQNAIIQQDELPDPPKVVQTLPALPANTPIIENDFGNDISSAIPQTSPGFDQKRHPLRNQNQVIHYPSPIVYTLTEVPVWKINNRGALIRERPLFYKI